MTQFNLNKSSSPNYELIMPLLPVTDGVRETDVLTLNIHTTLIPAITLNTTEMNWQGGVFPMSISPIVFEPWYVTFVVDSNWRNWFILYKWMEYITDGNSKYGEEYKKYMVDATLNIYDNSGNRIMGVSILNLYPTSLNEVVLTTREDATQIESGVNFNYTRLIPERVFDI